MSGTSGIDWDKMLQEMRERMERSMIVRRQGFMGFIILEDMDYFA